LEANPIPTEPGRPPLVDGVFELGVAQALYAEEMWPQLAEALAAAQAGDGSGILALYDQYYGRGPDGTYGNELEGVLRHHPARTIRPSAVSTPPSAERAKFEAVTRVGYTQAYELVICASFGTRSRTRSRSRSPVPAPFRSWWSATRAIPRRRTRGAARWPRRWRRLLRQRRANNPHRVLDQRCAQPRPSTPT
jgi:hypothetical protein